jgi:hypothetical protein
MTSITLPRQAVAGPDRWNDVSHHRGEDPRRAPVGRRWVTPALVGVRLVMVGVLMVGVPARMGMTLLWGDSVRYGEIAGAEGRAYRDHAVEYPPLTLAAIETVAGGHEPHDPDIARGVILVALAADLAAAGAIGWGFGARARLRYLVLGLPLVVLGLAYVRLDLLSVALAAGGLALCRRRRPTLGGLALVAGAFAKLWPAALLPVLAVQRRWRALAVSLGVGAAGMAAWVAYGGVDGLQQVLTMRGAHGWQIESLPGSIVHALHHEPARFEAGAFRVGATVSMLRWGLNALGIGLMAAAWARAYRRRVAFGGAALTALVALLVTAPLLSPQFLLWLLPAAAVLPPDRAGEAVHKIALVAVGTTALMLTMMEPLRLGDATAIGLLLLRNALLVALLVRAWRATTPTAPHDAHEATPAVTGPSPALTSVA